MKYEIENYEKRGDGAEAEDFVTAEVGVAEVSSEESCEICSTIEDVKKSGAANS